MRDEEERAERSVNRARQSSRPTGGSEFDFINLIRQQALKHQRKKTSSLIAHPSSLIHGIGDDAAVFEQRRGLDTVITTDLLVEEVDFRLRTTLPALLGHKALAVSLSDIAAMGARPRWALLSVGVPALIWQSNFLDEFYRGFFTLARRFRVSLIGGDVSRTPERVVIDSIVLGETLHGRAVLRATARPGDHIFVTGSLGGSYLGLKLLEGRKKPGRSLHGDVEPLMARLIKRHRRPEPRVLWGSVLGEERLASAMIDISDGLSSDLSHLCRESGVGARLDAARIPVDKTALRLSKFLPLDPLAAALHGGEDFELLFTVRPRNLARLPRRINGVAATYIGDVTGEPEKIVIREGARFRPLPRGGFEHFA
jgi:thiamine-monophosphate kinase